MPLFTASQSRQASAPSYSRPKYASSPRKHYPAGQSSSTTPSCASRITAFLAANPQYASSTAGDNGMTATGWVLFFRANPDCQTDPSVFVSNLPTSYSMPSPPAGQSCNDQITAFIAANPQFASTAPGDNGMTATGWAIFMRGAPNCATDPTVWMSQVQASPPVGPPQTQPFHGTVGLVPPGPGPVGGGGSSSPPVPVVVSTSAPSNNGFLLLGAAALGAWLLWPKKPARKSSRRSSRASV